MDSSRIPLFDTRGYITLDAGAPSFVQPLGGIGARRFGYSPAAGFLDLGVDLGGKPAPTIAPFNRFTLWTTSQRASSRLSLSTEACSVRETRQFPCRWTEFSRRAGGGSEESLVRVELLSFSPLVPGNRRLCSLPLSCFVFRIQNISSHPLDAALMLTWALGLQDLAEDALFDFQHDNLCLTGSIGAPTGSARQGIAVPDLHYEGDIRQGIEPWSVPDECEVVSGHFAADGELAPREAVGAPEGAAAWVKFTLVPGETREVPFILTWHLPVYESGPAQGKRRAYTQYLGRTRPDNSIVWLAEQAVQHFGAETPNYRYWMQELADWHVARGAAARAGGATADEWDAAMWEASRSDIAWPDSGPLYLNEPDPTAYTRAERALRELLPGLDRRP